MQVRFLPPWCKGESLPPSRRLTINRVKRGRGVGGLADRLKEGIEAGLSQRAIQRLVERMPSGLRELGMRDEELSL